MIFFMPSKLEFFWTRRNLHAGRQASKQAACGCVIWIRRFHTLKRRAIKEIVASPNRYVSMRLAVTPSRLNDVIQMTYTKNYRYQQQAVSQSIRKRTVIECDAVSVT